MAPATTGGETPIADCRRIFKLIDPKIKQRFIEKKVMYLRNYGNGFGLSWQTVFQTTERHEVEVSCRKAGIEFEWKENGQLRTRVVRPAVTLHPVLNEMIWFNHATFFHISTREPRIRDELLAEFKEEDLPTNSYYGDGSPIEPSILDEIREIYRQETTQYTWEKGDLLILDNMLSAHGRAPFSGERQVLVGMSDPHSRKED
jgi:alpha-ketoglutarate-dependent taurine dioxygenase